MRSEEKKNDTCRSAKAGYFASMYKRFGNLCYVFGALRGFWGHNNQDMRIKVRFDLDLFWKRSCMLSCVLLLILILQLHMIGKWGRMENRP